MAKGTTKNTLEQVHPNDESQINDQEESYSDNKKKKRIAKPKQKTTPNKKESKDTNKTPEVTQKKKTNSAKPKQVAKPKETKEPKDPKVNQRQDKKRDFLPGQKHPTPDEDDGAVAFYKSLYEKNPKSEMARKYCLEYGVLETQQALKLLKQVTKGRK